MATSRLPVPLLYNYSVGRLMECAISLQEEGEKALLQGDQKGLDLLEKAARLDPLSPDLLYRQGLALFEYGSYQNCAATLRHASRKFKQAAALNPELAEVWHTWATTLFLLSTLKKSPDNLLAAKEKIEAALKLTPNAEIYWDAALIYQKLTSFSGEIDDISKAITYFEKSTTLSTGMPHEFWTDFGKAYATLSEKIQDIRPVFKSVACFKQSLLLHLSNVEGWLGLGRGLKQLYFFSQDSEHYSQACDCFAAASQLEPKRSEIWIERIEFMIEAARLKRDSSKIRLTLKKCEQATMTLQVPNLHLEALWAEALALLGEWTGRIELIKESEQKIDAALDKAEEEDPFLINQNGKCLFSFAQYYQDLDLHYQSIEEFQYSISLDRSQLTCWAWMGANFAKVHDYSEDVGALEQAVYFYSKALQIKNDPRFYYEIAALLILMGEEYRTPEPIDQAISYLEYLFQSYKSIAFEHPEWFFEYGRALDLQGTIQDEPALHHKALEAFINVLMLTPSHPQIHHRIGVVLCHLGDVMDEVDHIYRALHHFKLAAKNQDENPTLLTDWGVSYITLSEFSTDSVMEESCLKEAEQKLLQAARLGSETVFYQLACLYSLQGNCDQSIFYLQKSYKTKNLPPLDEVMEDEWLEAVRQAPQFQEFLALLHKN